MNFANLVRLIKFLEIFKPVRPWTGLPANFGSNFAARQGFIMIHHSLVETWIFDCILRWKGIVEITKMGDYKIKLEAATSAILRLDM